MTTFSPAIGGSFAAETDAGPVELTLLSAETRDQQVPDAPAGWLPFNLVFLGPAEPMLPQRTYRLAGDVTGPVDIFLVPVARDAEGMRYEAVFG